MRMAWRISDNTGGPWSHADEPLSNADEPLSNADEPLSMAVNLLNGWLG